MQNENNGVGNHKYSGIGSKRAFVAYLRATDVSDADFIKAYVSVAKSNGTVADVAKALNWERVNADSTGGPTDLNRVRNRARQLINNGVKLPGLQRSANAKRVIDADALNSLIDDIVNGDSDE